MPGLGLELTSFLPRFPPLTAGLRGQQEPSSFLLQICLGPLETQGGYLVVAQCMTVWLCKHLALLGGQTLW